VFVCIFLANVSTYLQQVFFIIYRLSVKAFSWECRTWAFLSCEHCIIVLPHPLAAIRNKASIYYLHCILVVSVCSEKNNINELMNELSYTEPKEWLDTKYSTQQNAISRHPVKNVIGSHELAMSCSTEERRFERVFELFVVSERPVTTTVRAS